MKFIVVCTLIDNEYASLLFSQTFFRIVSECWASLQKFLKGKSKGPVTRCNIARNIARNIRHSTWLHGRNISCNIARNIWSAVTKLSQNGMGRVLVP